MDYYLVQEPLFKETNWCIAFRTAIKREANNMKLKVYIKVPTYKEALGNAILVLSSSKEWTNNIISTYDRNETILLIVGPSLGQEFDYSTVTIDFCLILENAVNYSRANNRNKILLFSPNPNSIGDNTITNHFRRLVPDGTVLQEKGTIETNIRILEKIKNEYDTIICCNSIVASALSQQIELFDKPNNFWIIALLDSPLARFSKKPITAFKQNEEEIGRLAIRLAYFLAKNKILTTVVWKSTPSIVIRESTNNTPYSINKNCIDCSSSINNRSKDLLYRDKNILNLITLEKFFTQLEDVDIDILKCIKSNMRYIDIAEKVYTSESTIKYRIKRMLNICKIENRDELLEFIDNYSPNFWDKV